MIKIHSRGYEVEKRMRKFFKGKTSSCDAIDFETKTSLYEVKSCNLFNISINNGNQRRDFKKQQHKQCSGMQLGRFHIIMDNHILLHLQSQKLKKIPKYIFVLKINNQIAFKVLSWDQVNKFVTNKKRNVPITIKEIFKND